VHDLVVSADEGGMMEYWTTGRNDYKFPRNVSFESKVETDLYEFAKNKTVPLNMSISPNGNTLVVWAADRKIRVFKLLSGKLSSVIDESLNHYSELQQVKQLLPPMEFGKKVSVEKDMARAGVLKYNNLVFDESSNFLLYSSFLGIKMINLTTQKAVRVFGQREHLRPLALTLFQGKPKSLSGTALTAEMEASDNPGLIDHGTDPTLVATAYKKNRFYLFTNRSAKDLSSVDNDRDVFNEKPSKEDIISATEERGAPRLYQAATIHTTIGDMHLDLFPRECPKTVENFCVHARNGYYNSHIFHRVIKQFMIQTGDPDGIGTGGESIWGGEFEDEFSPKLRHDRPYTVSMANAGANTNGSQFFITVCPTPWLDNKHTVFARVVRGMEIAQNISNVKTHPKTDKPYDDINIVSISIRNPVSL
jgi:peptidylprolyl isomerase domain and WD repeat-containing protein 1